MAVAADVYHHKVMLTELLCQHEIVEELDRAQRGSPFANEGVGALAGNIEAEGFGAGNFNRDRAAQVMKELAEQLRGIVKLFLSERQIGWRRLGLRRVGDLPAPLPGRCPQQRPRVSTPPARGFPPRQGRRDRRCLR